MIRDARTGNWIGTFRGHKGAVWSCRFDPEGYLAATASGDFSVQVWDAINGESLYTFGHRHVVKTVDWSFDSTRLATGGHEGILRVFDIGKPDAEPKMFVQNAEKKISISKCNWLDNSTVLAAGEDGIIRFWNVDEPDPAKQLIKTLTVNEDKAGIRDMELRSMMTGKTMLTVSSGANVIFFDMTSTSCTKLKSHKMPIPFREE